MAVGVITYEIAIVEPQHSFCMKHFEKTFFNILFIHWLIAVRSQQTLACSQYRAFTVTLYGTAFKHKLCAVFVFTLYYTGIIKLTVYGIVERCLELASPTVEAEIDIMRYGIAQKGNETVVSCPCVVALAFKETYVLNVYTILCEQCADLVHAWCHYKQLYARTYGAGKVNIAGNDLLEHIIPVGLFVRPCELHHLQLMPLGGQI